MTLPEDDESVFELFVDWLYHQRYDMSVLPSHEQSNEIKDIFMQRIQLYVLADKYNVPNLKSLVLSQIFLLIKQKSMPTMSTIVYAYRHTSQNAGIRRVFADHLACSLRYRLSQQLNFKNWLRKEQDIAIDMVCSVAKHTLKIQNPFDGEMPAGYLNDK